MRRCAAWGIFGSGLASLLALGLIARPANAAPDAVTAGTDPTFAEFAAELRSRIDALELGHLDAGYREVCARHSLDPEAPGLRQQYRRARVLFEATRDGGFFRLKWAVTNEEPTSKKIWESWRRANAFEGNGPSAIAECDELSTLYAFLGRSVGVHKLGVFWPTANHAIAAWEPAAGAPAGAKPTDIRVLVPTSQIFLGCEHGFDDTKFEPKKQRTVFEYSMPDVGAKTRLPAALAAELLERTRVYGAATSEANTLMRLARAERYESSISGCRDYRRTLAAKLRPSPSAADVAALAHYARTELGMPNASVDEALRELTR